MFKIGKLKKMVEMPNPISEDTKICEQKARKQKSVFTGQKAVQKIQKENMAGNLTTCYIVSLVTNTASRIDGNGYKISACPRIANPTGTDTGLDLYPRARARVRS